MSIRTENKSIYWAWKAMKQRCKNPKCKAYKNYGARGIKVCNEWEKFEPFLSWCLENGYQKGFWFTAWLVTFVVLITVVAAVLVM